jgi:hypothetical protein
VLLLELVRRLYKIEGDAGQVPVDLGLLPCECVKGVGTTLKTAPNAVFCYLSPDSTPYAVTCWLGDENARLAMRDASLGAGRLGRLRFGLGHNVILWLTLKSLPRSLQVPSSPAWEDQ